MLPLANLGAFALAAFLLIVIPGPSVLFTIGRSLAYGRRGGLLSVLGNAIGTLPATALVTLGLGQLIAESIVVFTAVKITGALYLMYLGVQAIRHRDAHAASPSGPAPVPVMLGSSGRASSWPSPTQDARVLHRGPAPVRQPRRRFGAPAARRPRLPVRRDRLCCDSVWALIAGTARTWFGRNPRRLSQMRLAAAS